MIPFPDLKEFLEEKYHKYNNPSFIDQDPISIPHFFTRKEDIEIAGFLTATISWGNRAGIVKDATRLFTMMDCTPFEFIMNSSAPDLKPFGSFYHRTFNGQDCIFFMESLRNIYQNYGGLEDIFSGMNKGGIKESIAYFRNVFLEVKHQSRSDKHIANPSGGASAKRILMFLRWMVRNDGRGVDFGLWKKIDTMNLYCPIDVHSGNVARKLGLLKRKSNDWKAVEELTANLRKFDPADPVKYDFALFGLGVFERF